MSDTRTPKGWKKGPPPSIGLWPASVSNDTSCLRWWDGVNWSEACWYDTPIHVVKIRATLPDRRFKDIYWRDRPTNWPKESYT